MQMTPRQVQFLVAAIIVVVIASLLSLGLVMWTPPPPQPATGVSVDRIIQQAEEVQKARDPQPEPPIVAPDPLSQPDPEPFVRPKS